MPEYRRVGRKFFGRLVTDYRNYQVLECVTRFFFLSGRSDPTYSADDLKKEVSAHVEPPRQPLGDILADTALTV